MRRRDTRGPTLGPIKPEADITLATRFPVPVLITAPPDRAIAVAHAIAAGSKRKRPQLVMCDGAAIVTAALEEPRARRKTDGEVVLVVREVHALTDTEQAALMLLLFDGEKIGRRIISTSSVCLLDRVRRGAFDAVLFYRLNTIHIMSPSSSDAAGAA